MSTISKRMLDSNETLLAQRTFCFLLGAGASVPAGIPPMQKLGERFRERIEEKSPSLAGVFDSVPRNHLFADWHERSNIETLLFFLYAAADLKRDPAGELGGV